MVESRKRRIVRRAVVAVAVPLLLSASYASSYGILEWLWGRDEISQADYLWMKGNVFTPLESYRYSDAVGSHTFDDFCFWCLKRGQRSQPDDERNRFP
jgi:hypothetical protein